MNLLPTTGYFHQMKSIRYACTLATLAALPLSVVAAPIHAQDQTVDEGTLVITRNGTPVGREAFRVVRTPGAGGQAYRATATLSIDTLRLALRLTTTASGAPLSFEMEVRARSVLTAQVSGSGRPERFNTLTRTPHGEAARAYVMGPDPLLLDDDVFVPYFFAVLPPTRSRFSIINPRAGSQATFQFQERGQESLRVGRRTEQARHYALITPNGASRDIWVSAKGLLLRVAIPARGLVAQRDELPQ